MIMVGTITSSMAHLRKVPPRLIPTMPYEHKLVYNISVSSSHHQKNGIGRFRIYTSMSSSSAVSTEQIEPQWKPESQPQQEMEVQSQEGKKFDWYAQWYPVMPVCDLDKRVPHGKTVMGIEVVVWWDRNEAQWKVFDDRCPHRLAPLSEGRIDQWGRLQCVYHGWCFSGSGHCKFIPQAPPDGPPVNTTTKACVAVYPSTVQNGIIWFWPNSEPQYGDILQKKQPPYISEIDDPSFTTIVGNRDIFYGYEVLIENLMDPAHIPYAHYGLMQTIKPKVKRDREGGRPLDMSIRKLDLNGFIAKQEWGSSKFIPPCIFYAYPNPPDTHEDNGTLSSAGDASKVREESTAGIPQRKALLIFICVPVSPGKSRLIWAFPRNFAVWIDRVLPRWFFHIRQNLVLDSDLYLLHVQERKIAELGPANWQRACYVPTKSDALVVGFRRWIIKYSGGKVDWGNRFSGALPPTPPREQLMDRYWTHVVNCSSCSSAVKGLNALEVSLQIVSVAALGVVAATKQNAISAVARTSLVGFAVVCFAASRWLSHFVYKTFYYHDYHHALK